MAEEAQSKLKDDISDLTEKKSALLRIVQHLVLSCKPAKISY
ncbi:MAG: hypothetical protein CM15mP49_01410 [Actinomycetota bacterium]|nr:MAG: hypothetical protein CM15mP49_01410 [Actinomycetota bacterium]